MPLRDVVKDVLIEEGRSHRELAQHLQYERSTVTKILNGQREWPEDQDSRLASFNWKFALAILDERSGGFVSNILEDLPGYDIHPAALKDELLRDLEEALKELEELRVSKHIDPEKRKKSAEKVWMEMKDVVDKGLLMMGVMEEEFMLNRQELIKKHEYQVKKGER